MDELLFFPLVSRYVSKCLLEFGNGGVGECYFVNRNFMMQVAVFFEENLQVLL